MYKNVGQNCVSYPYIRSSSNYLVVLLLTFLPRKRPKKLRGRPDRLEVLPSSTPPNAKFLRQRRYAQQTQPRQHTCGGLLSMFSQSYDPLGFEPRRAQVERVMRRMEEKLKMEERRRQEKEMSSLNSCMLKNNRPMSVTFPVHQLFIGQP